MKWPMLDPTEQIYLEKIKELIEPFFRTIMAIQKEEGNLSKVYRRLRTLLKHSSEFEVYLIFY